MAKDKRYKIERYSPSREKWIDFSEVFPRKKDADDRVMVLTVRHMAQQLQFRVVDANPVKKTDEEEFVVLIEKDKNDVIDDVKGVVIEKDKEPDVDDIERFKELGLVD